MNNQLLLILVGAGLLFMMAPRRGNAKTLIKEFEGFSLVPYVDQSGRRHIGYGHLLEPGEDWESITMGQAEWLLTKDLREAEECIRTMVTVPLNSGARAALTSLIYNIGCGAFGGSTLLRKLNAGDYDGAADEFLRWNKVRGEVSQGLVDRRFIERGVFLGTESV